MTRFKAFLLAATTVGVLVCASPASAYMHAVNCFEGLNGANGDNEIEQTRPFAVAGEWQVDILELIRAGEHSVAWSWRWAERFSGRTFWVSGECVGDDWAYVDRLIGPGR